MIQLSLALVLGIGSSLWLVFMVRYSPLQANGHGLQGIYLTELSSSLAQILLALVGPEAPALMATAQTTTARFFVPENDEVDLWERKLEGDLLADKAISETQRVALVNARRGQGLFKRRVMAIESCCRVTKVDNQEHLIASHCKPWRDANDEERLSGDNGLLLTPSIDRLFDRGFITFASKGDLIISPVAHGPSLKKMGVETNKTINVGSFTEGQQEFLRYHRDAIFLKARIG